MTEKILVNIKEAMDTLSIGRSKLLELAYDGTIPSIKVGRRRLFPVDGLANWAREEMRTNLGEHNDSP